MTIKERCRTSNIFTLFFDTFSSFLFPPFLSFLSFPIPHLPLPVPLPSSVVLSPYGLTKILENDWTEVVDRLWSK